MISRTAKKISSYVLTVSMTMYPLYPYADEFSDVGKEGQAYSKELVDGFNNAPPQLNGGVMTLPSLTNGTFNNTSTTTVNIDDLFPGTSSTSGSSMSEFFPAAAMPDVDALTGISSDGDGMDDLGQNFQSGLWDDANSSSPSTTGAAYKVMMDMANMSKPDLTNDPVMNLTKDIFTNIETISAEFGD